MRNLSKQLSCLVAVATALLLAIPVGAGASATGSTSTTSMTTTTTAPPTTVPSLCGSFPDPSCKTGATGKSLALILNKGGAKNDQVKYFLKNGDATDVSEFGDPATGLTRTGVCLYSTSSRGGGQPLVDVEIEPGGTCGRKACWKRKGKKGVLYKSKTGAVGGVKLIKMLAGESGKASVSVKAGGFNLATPELPMIMNVVGQVVMDGDGLGRRCWQTEFSTSKKNEDEKFIANGP